MLRSRGDVALFGLYRSLGVIALAFLIILALDAVWGAL